MTIPPVKPNLRRKPHVLFLGETNTARTQMAEAYGRQMLEDLVEVKSAGLNASELDPRTLRALQDDGIDATGLRAKPLDQILLDWADLVITLCVDSQRIDLPAQDSFVHKNWPLDNPARLAGDPVDISPYLQARDDIKRRVRQLSNSIRLMYR